VLSSIRLLLISSSRLSSYTRGLLQTTARLEALLKVIVTPDASAHLDATSFECSIKFIVQDPPEGFILNYTLLIGDASFSNFQKVP
jgi:vacuolar protein sorting-associated protein 53